MSRLSVSCHRVFAFAVKCHQMVINPGSLHQLSAATDPGESHVMLLESSTLQSQIDQSPVLLSCRRSWVSVTKLSQGFSLNENLVRWGFCDGVVTEFCFPCPKQTVPAFPVTILLETQNFSQNLHDALNHHFSTFQVVSCVCVEKIVHMYGTCV